SGSTSLASATAGAELDPRAGPLDLRIATRARGRIAGASDEGDATREGTLGMVGSAGVPLVRRFESPPGSPPLTHWIEPLLEAGALAGDRRGDFFVPALGPLPRSAWELAAGVSTSFGTYAARAVRLDVRAGGAGF